MLDIFLEILSVVGILLLVMTGLLFAAILLVLFFPVTYRMSGKKSLDEMIFMAKASWLFGLLRLRYKYPEPGKMTVKLLWFTIYDPSEDSDSDQETDGKKDGKKRRNKKYREKVETKAEAQEETMSDSAQKSEKTESAETDRPEDAKEEKTEEKTGSWISQKIAKIQYTIRSMYDKIKEIWQNISYYKELFSDRETKQLLSHVMLRVNKILKHLRPRKLKAEILFGTGAPDTTGYAYGVYGMLMPMLGPSVLVTPDFQRAVLEGSFQASGFTTLSVLLGQVLQVIRDKRLKRFLNKLKSPGAESREN